ncbi:MAG TPA: TIGR03118 family protein [Chloroflexia bacterium]|nr:TIGR03118 family protein [Chloroflexia bacterium]
MSRRVIAFAGKRLALLSSTLLLLVFLLPAVASARDHDDEAGFYTQQNLVSDIPGLAALTDSNLRNPWGLSRSPSSPWWVSDNATGLSTLYNGNGARFPLASPLVVTIPVPGGGTSAPSGTVFNGTSGFVIAANGKSAASLFLFDTEDGTIAGWAPSVNPTMAIIAKDNSSSGAIYKGLTIATTSSGTFIYAANFHSGKVEVYDQNFNPVTRPGGFSDHKIPSGFAPFGIQNIGGQIYVTYAKQKLPDKKDDQAGPGNGFVDVYSPTGKLQRRLVSRGYLNSPWGLALAPADFGSFSNKLLVGNFGDGRINVYDPHSGKFLGQLKDTREKPITIDGLWALAFGNDANAGKHNELFFTAGLNDEADGLFGKLTFVKEKDEDRSYR